MLPEQALDQVGPGQHVRREPDAEPGSRRFGVKQVAKVKGQAARRYEQRATFSQPIEP
jgi:hypothetical protein